jgi:hypothetical protein
VIAAVTTLLDEAHIIGSTVAHLYNQGVDEIYAYVGPCTDNTREVLAPFPVTILNDDEPVHYQPKLMTELTHLAGRDGAEWIIPFDADEYWYPETQPTIKDALAGVAPEGGVIRVGVLHYHTRERRQPTTKWNTKVAFRYSPTAELTNGNHDVHGIGGQDVYGVLIIRELQYSSFEHFTKKIADRCRTLDPAMRARGDGTHHTDLECASPAELQAAWEQLSKSADVQDPMP